MFDKKYLFVYDDTRKCEEEKIRIFLRIVIEWKEVKNYRNLCIVCAKRQEQRKENLSGSMKSKSKPAKNTGRD